MFSSLLRGDWKREGGGGGRLYLIARVARNPSIIRILLKPFIREFTWTGRTGSLL